ncbi:MAG: SLBB domain-containing protein [bacterium]
MNFKFFNIFILIFSITPAISFSQFDKQKVGNDNVMNQQGGFYNYGDKDKVNIDVNVWGYVKFPGKYLVPKGTTILDLISYSGGPLTDSKLEDIRLYRPKSDSLKIVKDKVIVINYNDLVWEERAGSKDRINTALFPGDILILTGEPRYFARDNVNLALSISSVLISLGILVLSIISISR